MIHKFDTCIYPRNVWVAVTPKESEITDKFLEASGRELSLDDLYEFNFEACAFRVRDKETKELGCVIWFPRKSSMTVKIIAHESVHCALDIFEDVGAIITPNNQEPFAYLVGFCAECCQKVKTNSVFPDNNIQS